MQTSRRWLLFVLLLAGAALFIVVTGQALPPLMASHFSGSGAANGAMPRSAYLVLMSAIAAGVPLLIVVLQAVILGITGTDKINLPNRDYWLAPERKAATLAFLNLQAMRFGGLLAVFLCVVHWLVVKANAVQPPRLDSTWFVSALVLFFMAMAIWLTRFYRRFRRIR